ARRTSSWPAGRGSGGEQPARALLLARNARASSSLSLQMTENRRLALFGASGGKGGHLIPLLLERGFEGRGVVRGQSSISLEHERLEVVQGDLLDPTATGKAIAGTDAVISLAGPRKLGPTRIYSEGGRNLIAGMRSSGVKRGIFVTALGTSREFRMP